MQTGKVCQHPTVLLTDFLIQFEWKAESTVCGAENEQ
jgi:hypothetical protein